MQSGEYSTVEVEGHLLTVTINRPEVRNAIHPPAAWELSNVLDQFADDPQLWVAIVTGAVEWAVSTAAENRG